MTVSVALPLLPSLVAVMDVVPALTDVTSPEAFTVATPVFEDAHVITRPVSVMPLASRVTALACVVAPATSEFAPSVTLTVATGAGGGAVTVSATDPVLPSLVAMMFAVPTPTAVTAPLAVTVATFVLEVDQVTVRPFNTTPSASRVIAVACVVPPVCSDVAPSAAVTVATGAGGGAFTVTDAVPLRPSLVAVIVAVPGDAPVTTPLADTVATDAFDDVNSTTRPVSVLPAASRTSATACVVAPTISVDAPSESDTLATGAGDTVTPTVAAVPSLMAVIVAVPTRPPVTTPAAETDATAASLLVNVTVRSVSAAPLRPRGTALMVAVAPGTS